MTKLTGQIEQMLLEAVRICGTYEPNEVIGHFEENLTKAQYATVFNFLEWCDHHDVTFGRGNIQAVYAEFYTAHAAVIQKRSQITAFTSVQNLLAQARAELDRVDWTKAQVADVQLGKSLVALEASIADATARIATVSYEAIGILKKQEQGTLAEFGKAAQVAKTDKAAAVAIVAAIVANL